VSNPRPKAVCKHGVEISLKPSINSVRCAKCDEEADRRSEPMTHLERARALVSDHFFEHRKSYTLGEHEDLSKKIADLLMQVRKEALEEAANIAMERSLVCQDAVKTYERRKGEDENWKKYLVLSEGCAAREADHIERTIRSLKVSP